MVGDTRGDDELHKRIDPVAGAQEREARRPNDSATGPGGSARGTSSPATSPAAPDTTLGAASTYAINSGIFVKQLKELRELRSFVRRTTTVSTQEVSLGILDRIEKSKKGREPSPEEWQALERTTQLLYSQLTPELRHKYALGAVTGPMALAALCLLCLASLSLALVIELNTRSFVLTSYLIWLISLGAIGSIASLGMNILSVQKDVTFDLKDKRHLLLRVVLGALFGLVLTLPLGFHEFSTFTSYVDYSIYKHGDKPETPDQWTQLILLLLPFILGFSTSLVITVLNRLVTSVQAFFGSTNGGEPKNPDG